MTIYLSLLSALVGIVLYAISINSKVQHIGDVLFWTGWLVFLFQVGGRVFSALHG